MRLDQDLVIQGTLACIVPVIPSEILAIDSVVLGLKTGMRCTAVDARGTYQSLGPKLLFVPHQYFSGNHFSRGTVLRRLALVRV